MLDATKDVFRLAQEGAAGARQRDVMTAPIEQRDADLYLELADLLAERGLRRVQAGRGAREIQFLGHCHEVPQMPQFHPDRLDGAAKNRNREAHTVSRGMSYEDGLEREVQSQWSGILARRWRADRFGRVTRGIDDAASGETSAIHHGRECEMKCLPVAVAACVAMSLAVMLQAEQGGARAGGAAPGTTNGALIHD